MSQIQQPGTPEFFPSPFRLVLLTFLSISGYFLIAEHWVHVLGYLPLALLLFVCVGMHFFMHGSHGHGHDGHNRPDENGPKPPQQEEKTP